MTLHLEQLIRDIEQLGQSAATGERGTWLEAARDLLLTYDQPHLDAKVASELGDGNRRAFERLLIPKPLDPLGTRVPAPEAPATYTAIAADGSNVAPDRDNSAYYYVLNTGLVTLRYGDAPAAEIRAHAQLYYKPADLYWDERRLIPMDATRLSHLMRVEEIAILPDLAEQVAPPCVVMVDGQLVMWGLQNEKKDRWGLMARLNDAFGRLRDLRVPIIGYISNTASFELVNTLRLYLCPTSPATCQTCTPYGPPDVTLCHHLNGVRDPSILFRHLEKNERSGLFASQATILDGYDEDHKIVYFYFNTGDEIARVEIPRWTAEDPDLLELVHGVIADQCRRTGRMPPYPPVLHEAHEAAVITTGDRANLQLLIEEQLQRNGQFAPFQPAKTFHKRLRGV